MLTPIPWHRLFGMALTELFTGRPWQVELEKELALKSQRLDVLIIEQRGGKATGIDPQAFAGLPDGLENLVAHNVLTYKSAHEALDAWAIEELLGHYVTYRKLASGLERSGGGTDATAGSARRLLPAADFRLYAVATRMPTGLLGELPATTCRPTSWPGVFDLYWGTREIRLVVLDAIAKHPRNAAWELFSAQIDRIRHGLIHYQPPDGGPGTFLSQLLVNYHAEVPQMSYTVEDFERDSIRSITESFPSLPPEKQRVILHLLGMPAMVKAMKVEEWIAALTPAERLQGLDPAERLQGLDPEERLRGLAPAERLRGLDPEQLLAEIDPETVRAWLERKTS